jgi:hypothetical protein
MGKSISFGTLILNSLLYASVLSHGTYLIQKIEARLNILWLYTDLLILYLHPKQIITILKQNSAVDIFMKPINRKKEKCFFHTIMNTGFVYENSWLFFRITGL